MEQHFYNNFAPAMFFRTKANYGEEKEKFVYALSLVFIQCIVNAVFAKAGNFHFLLVFNHLYNHVV